MKNMLVAVFPDERSAHAGSAALTRLNRGDFTVRESTVIARKHDGTVTMLAGSEHGPIGMIVGMVGGGVIGSLGGPGGAIVGALIGISGGLFYDLFRSGLDIEFVDEAAAALEPGDCAVVVDMDERSTTTAAAFLAPYGGRVVRAQS